MQNQIDMFETHSTMRLDACETFLKILKEEVGNIRRGFFAREANRDVQINALSERIDSLSFALESLADILLKLEKRF